MFVLHTGAGPGGRKVKRVSDVNAMGGPPPQQQQPPPYIADPFAAVAGPAANYGAGAPYVTPAPVQHSDYVGYPTTATPTQATDYADFNAMPAPQQHQQHQHQQHQHAFQPAPPPAVGGQQPTMFMPNAAGMFQQPIVQDMAMQYGQRLADQGKQMVESHIEKYLPLTRLKYYFAVDNKYVMNKMRLLFFPFTHTVRETCESVLSIAITF